MKKRIFFLLFFILILAVPGFADNSIDSVFYSAEISTSGKVTATTTVQMYFDSTETTVSFPLPSGTLKNVSVRGYKTKVTEADGMQTAEISGGGFVGSQSFTLSYELSDVLPDDSENDNLTLEMLSSAWGLDIESFSYQVLLPTPNTALSEDFTYQQVITSGYTGQLEESAYSGNIKGTLLTGQLDDLMAYESVSIELPLPEGYFYVRKATIPGVSVGILTAILAGILLLCILFWWFRIRTRHEEPPTSRMLLPEGAEPYQLAQILHCSEPDFGALILYWANLGYLNLRLSRRGTLYMVKQLEMGTERGIAERKLFAKIFRNSVKAPLYPGKYADDAESFIGASSRPLNRYMLDRKGGNISLIRFPLRLIFAFCLGYTAYAVFPEGTIYMIISLFIGMIGLFLGTNLEDIFYLRATDHQYSFQYFGSIILAVVFLVISLLYGTILEMSIGMLGMAFSIYVQSVGPRRNDTGKELTRQVKGCREFYKNLRWQKAIRYQNQNPAFFQRHYPLAAALHQEKKFSNAFDRTPIPRPAWMPVSKKKRAEARVLNKELRPILKQIRKAFQ